MVDPFYLYALAAFVVVACAVPLTCIIAGRVGLMDMPGGRKVHEGRVPLVGGLVIFPVFIVISIFSGADFATYWPLYAGIVVLLATGVIDDRVEIHPRTKFLMQFVAALLIVLPGEAQLHQLGNLFGLGDFGLGFMSLPFSVVAVVLLINAINLMDGLDGLAGGVSFVILGWFLAACLMAGEGIFCTSIIILMGALAGFLVYNMRCPFRQKAAIFLGDAGSMCLGLMIAWYAIHLSLVPNDGSVSTLEPISVAWIMALPIWDECAQFYRRVREGRHPFSPDRGHFHYRFIDAGMRVRNAVMFILSLVFLMGAVGVLGMKLGIPLVVLTGLWIVGILAHMGFSRDLRRYARVIGRFLKHPRDPE